MKQAVFLVVFLTISCASVSAKNENPMRIENRPMQALKPCGKGVAIWEYAYEKFRLDSKTKATMGKFTKWLNEVGQQGWELIEFDDQAEFGMFLTFKRPLCRLS
jgi:hypothetical protein